MDQEWSIPQEIAKATPPAVIVTLDKLGLSLGDIVTILTGVYVTLQIIFLLRDRWWKPRKQRKAAEK